MEYFIAIAYNVVEKDDISSGSIASVVATVI